MDKAEISRVLEEIGTLLELKGENPFKVRAYYNVANIVGGLAEDIGALIAENRLTEIRGIGKNLADHITELHRTGKIGEYEKMYAAIPGGVWEMLSISGLGPKKVKVLWEKLKITGIRELREACESGKVARLEGFGKKTAQNILAGIAQYEKHSGQFLWAAASAVAQVIFPVIEKHPKVFQAEVAGSFRRRKEIVRDLDFLAATDDPAGVMKAFVTLPQVERVLAEGETKASVVLKSGMQVDLRCVKKQEFPFALHYFTGSKEHNTHMRMLAKDRGWKLNEYGLFDGEKLLACKDESALFSRLGMQYIPPELREERGEIEAALQKALPDLITENEIRGVFHCHSTWSDGRATLAQMAMGAKELGFEYLGIADHSQVAAYAGGLDTAKIKKQRKEIEALNKKIPGLHIFQGLEADILPDGSVDMGDSILGELDYVVASVHSKFKMSEKEMTARIVKAVKNKRVTMLGHVTGRLLLEREGYPVHLETVIQACADYGVAIEINANPLRLDLDWRFCPMAKEKGVRLIINPDAHSVEGLKDVRYGVAIARKGWLTAKDIVNTKNLKEIKAWLKA